MCHLPITLLVIYQLVCSQSNFCIWGTKDADWLNGIYTEQGTHQNKPYYSKSAGPGCDTHYIFWSDDSNDWNVNDILGASSVYAYCDSSSTLSNCNQWYVWNDDWVIDPEFTISTSSCPTLHCDTITIENSPNNCGTSSFDVSLGNNVWTNSANNKWWYFEPQDFSWHCNDKAPTYACNINYLAYTQEGWTDVSKGQSISIQFDYPDNNFRTLNCIADSTSQPTASPVISPTASPVNSPTTSPVNSPTTSPVNSPTASPIKIPTQSPTNNPTNNPSTHPTHNPSNIPSIIPTRSPGQTPTPTHVLMTPSTTKNPSQPTLSVTNGGIDEGSVGERNTTLFIILTVFLVLMFICCALITATFVYKYKKDNSDKTVYAINDKNTYGTNVLQKVASISHIDNEGHVHGDVKNITHLQMVHKDPEVIEDTTPGNNGNSLEINNDILMEPGSLEPKLKIGKTSDILDEEGETRRYDNQQAIISKHAVEKWFENKVKLTQYVETFVENGYDSLEIIAAITEDSELNDMNIVLKGHVRKIMSEIKKLRKEMDQCQ